MELSTVLCLVLLTAFKTNAKLNALHPFLYFNEGDLPQLRRQAQTTHKHIAGKLQRVVHKITKIPNEFPPSDWEKFSSRWNENYGNNLCGLALYCVLNDKDLDTRKYVFRSMDIFAKLPNWRVKASMRDDVPVAHSLNGMATAYDLLYPYMSKNQREKYISKIANVTFKLYLKTAKKKGAVWWSKSYIQNHVATNFAAMLTGALVVSRHERYAKSAKRWTLKAHQMLSKTMHLLQYVVDGSMNEGVSYGSYTSRSITQYLFLAMRHLKADLTKNIWLREHFWFMYYTTMHGFNQTIGIADSGTRWFYGPQSQLYFLDSFVLKSGYANWLANKIQMAGFQQSADQIMSTIHTEFIFYNASIIAKAPPDYYQEQLHVFSDWGVSVYRRGLATRGYGNRSVYLSFKCGVLHGEAVNQMVIGTPPVPWIKGWQGFNPGHEHVDQGSFVFAPNGIPFITDTYYGPKYTWLNNAILFAPSSNSPCSSPLEGQIGECLKWFDFQKMSAWRARGKIVTSTTEKGLVLMCGEMVTWYRRDLGLASVYRCLVMLSPGILLVLDHVEKKNDSSVQQMNAFFHNGHNKTFYTEECWEKNNYACAGLKIDGEKYRAMWVNSHGTKSTAEIGDRNFNVKLKKIQTSFLNISTPLYSKYTRVAYLFAGPGNEIASLRINSAQDHGLYITVVVNERRYTVALVTKHALPLVRYRWLGFGGFGKVNVEEKRGSGENEFIQRKVIQFGIDVINKTQHKPTKRRPPPPDTSNSVFTLFIPAAVVCAMLFFYFQLTRIVKFHRFSMKCFVLLLLVVYGVLSLAEFLKGCSKHTRCFWTPTVRHQRELYGFVGETKQEQPPFVVYTSLPWAGSELMGELFKTNSDFFQFDVTNSYFHQNSLINISLSRARSSIISNDFLDLCSTFQLRHSDYKTKTISHWFRSYLSNPMILGPNFPQKALTSLPAINLKDPGWALRFHWLRRALGMRMKAMVVVRDPRSWVNTWLSELKGNPTLLRNTKDSINMLIKMGCNEDQGEKFAQELKIIQGVLLSVDKKHRDILGTRLLAQLWAAHTNALLRMTRIVPKDQIRIFRLEDLILRPKKTVQRVYQFLSMSLPPLVDQRLQQVTRTKQFKFVNTHEKIGPDMNNAWRKSLTVNQILEIESICSLVMTQLNYKPM